MFERSRVQRILIDDDHVRVRTRHGAVTADRVVIATGYATPAFRPLAGRFRMYRTYVLASESLGPAQRRRLGLSDVLLWDAERPYHYARWTSDHRLLLGGSDRLVRPRQRRGPMFAAATRELRAYFETQFSSLDGNGDADVVGGAVRHDARQSALHRAASPLSAPLVRLGLRWQRHDVRFSGGATAARAMAESRFSRPCAVRVWPNAATRLACALSERLRSNHLHNRRVARIRFRIEDVDARRVDPWHDQIAALHVRCGAYGQRQELHAFQPKWCSSSPR